MILLLDNYDSFTFNLYDYLSQLGAEVEVVRNDAISIKEISVRNYQGIVISPGPGRPETSGIIMDVIKTFHQETPILGVCLGMQAIGLFFNYQLVRADYPFHGKVSTLDYDATHPMFRLVSAPLEVCRYHSLILQNNRQDGALQIVATTKKGEIMALAHNSLPLWGFQFHPEAILTAQGMKLLENWLVYFNIK